MTNKYHAIKTYSNLCERLFDSKAECRRGEELHLLQMADEISGLEYQVKLVLCEKPKITITIDFKYKDYLLRDRMIADPGLRGTYVVYEDTKGMGETREFRVKRIWLKEKYNINIVLSGETKWQSV